MNYAEFLRLVGSIDLRRPSEAVLLAILMRELEVLRPSHAERLMVMIAFKISFKGHEYAPLRSSGEAAIFHSFRAAIKSIRRQARFGIKDIQLLIDIILHDNIEDAAKAGIDPVLIEREIRQGLGVEVTTEVLFLTKRSERSHFNENLLACDRYRVGVAKFDDRLDNVDTLFWLPEKDQKRKIRETEHFYFGPLLVRIDELLHEELALGNITFAYLEYKRALHHELVSAVIREKLRLGMK